MGDYTGDEKVRKAVYHHTLASASQVTFKPPEERTTYGFALQFLNSLPLCQNLSIQEHYTNIFTFVNGFVDVIFCAMTV